MPVRKIPLGRRSLTGRHNWDERALGVAFESSLERDFITLMLLDPKVVAIEEQPVQIRYTSDGRSRHYTPDFLVESDQAPTLLVEVKFSADLEAHREDLQPKLDAGAAYATGRGWRFEVWTEREIRVPRLENATFLLPFRRRKVDPGLCARLLRHLDTLPPTRTPISSLLAACWDDDQERARGVAALWHLLAVGQLKADLDAPLGMDSSIWMNGTSSA